MHTPLAIAHQKSGARRVPMDHMTPKIADIGARMLGVAAAQVSLAAVAVRQAGLAGVAAVMDLEVAGAEAEAAQVTIHQRAPGTDHRPPLVAHRRLLQPR